MQIRHIASREGRLSSFLLVQCPGGSRRLQKFQRGPVFQADHLHPLKFPVGVRIGFDLRIHRLSPARSNFLHYSKPARGVQSF